METHRQGRRVGHPSSAGSIDESLVLILPQSLCCETRGAENGRGGQGRVSPIGMTRHQRYDTGLSVGDEVAATILLPAGFVGLHAEGLFLAPTGGSEAVGRNAEADEILLNGVGATVAEGEIVFGGAAFVAMAFDGDAGLGIVLEEAGGLLKRLTSVRTNFSGIVIEEGVADFLGPEFIEAGGFGFGDGRGDANGDADGGVGVAAGRTGGEGIGSGLGGRDGGGALKSGGAGFGSDGGVGGVCSGPGELRGFALIDGSAIGAEGGRGRHRSRRGSVGRRFRGEGRAV